MGSGAFLVEACRQLGDALVESWHTHDEVPTMPPDEDEVIFARRIIAQRCLYGVDRNPVAVDLSKVSLWLATMAKDRSLTFLDHALRHGDSLVGLSREQIEAFHWIDDEPNPQAGLEAAKIQNHVANVAKLRDRISQADESVADSELRSLWDEAELELSEIRSFGDLVVDAYFKGKTDRERESKRKEYAGVVISGEAGQYRGWLEELRHAEPPLAPFHWEIEFPEVYDRENAGFDAIVGNPPFGGHVTVVRANLAGYTEWLRNLHPESSGQCDLVAHFFRRSFNLVRKGGVFGLIATNTIAQGDTRASGLRWICKHGGEIYRARKRVRWPGTAAVVVSVLHIAKGAFVGQKRVDDRDVDKITAFLFHRGGHDDPRRLGVNEGKSFAWQPK